MSVAIEDGYLHCANCFEQRPGRYLTIIDDAPWCNDRDGCIIAAESLPIPTNPEAVNA